MSNPYKRMFLVSEDEYVMMGRNPEQQARLNAIALQDERNVRVADKQEVSDEGHEEKKALERKLEFHDQKHLHEAPKAKKLKTEDDDEPIKWDDVPLDTARWDVLPLNIRMKARLLMTLVNKYAKVNDRQEFQHQSRPVSGSNTFDLVRWAVAPTRAKGAQPPTGWSEFMYFLSINKAIPRSVLSKPTLFDLNTLDASRVKKAKLTVPVPPFFETLYP